MTTTLGASTLAAPPPPPIPALDRPLAPDDLAAALRAFSTSYYANHPFHQMMHEGRLTQRQLQGWVANRLAYQRAIPRKDAAILSNCPESEIRRLWLQRITTQPPDDQQAQCAIIALEQAMSLEKQHGGELVIA